MITDAQLIFSEEQDVSGATTLSTNVYDTGPLASGNAGVDLGLGEPLYLFVRVTTAFAGTGSITVDLDSDSTVNLATSPTTHVTLSVPTGAAVGATYVATLPPSIDYERYIGINYTDAGAISAGSVTAGLVRDIAQIKQHASGLNFA